jgi:hypothetical protein
LISHLKAVWVLVSRPFTTIRLEQEALFVFFTDVVVKILSKGELAVQL